MAVDKRRRHKPGQNGDELITMITLGDSNVVPLPRSTLKNGRDRGKVKATKAVRQMEIK